TRGLVASVRPGPRCRGTGRLRVAGRRARTPRRAGAADRGAPALGPAGFPRRAAPRIGLAGPDRPGRGAGRRLPRAVPDRPAQPAGPAQRLLRAVERRSHLRGLARRQVAGALPDGIRTGPFRDPLRPEFTMNAPSADLLQGVAQLARLGGRPLSPTALQAQCTRDRDGRLNLESLRSALAAGGLDLARTEGSLAQLERAGLPALAALEGDRYRVVSGADELHSADLERAYGGHFFKLTPRPAPDMRSEIPARRNARAWFWRVLWGLRHYYAHVALATLLVNVLSIAVSLYVMNVYDRVVPNRTYETLWVLTIGTVGALVFDFAARMLRGWLVDTAGKRADLEISAGLFQRLLGIQLIQKPASSGAFVSNLRDFEAIREVLTSATLTALIDLPFFLLFVVVIAAIAPPLALVPLVAIAVVLVVGALVQAPLARSIRDSMKEGSQRQGLAVETVEGLETLKVNNAQAHAQQRWEWFTETVALASMKARNLSNLVINATSTMQQLATVATAVIGVYLIHDGRLSMGGLIGAAILCGRAIAPLGQVAALAVRLQQARTAFDGLQALIDKTSERDPERSYLSLQSVRGDVAFSGVDFSHDPQGSTLFRGLNLSIRAGEKVAILGRTGSGKSTLLRLAAGLYTP